VDGFFEWRAIKGARTKQPYAIAMKDGSPFGLAGLWENWRNPNTGEWERRLVVSFWSEQLGLLLYIYAGAAKMPYRG